MNSLNVLASIVLNKFDILAIILKKLENEGVWRLRTVNEVNILKKRTEKFTRLQKLSQELNF
jgi:hypothetical protein